MRAEKYSDINKFENEVYDILMQNEAQNNLILNNIMAGKEKGIDNWLLMTVKDNDGGVLLIVMHTPPYKLLLYSQENIKNEQALLLLTNELISMGYSFPGILTEENTCNRFAELYCEKTGIAMANGLKMNLMVLKNLKQVEASHGYLRPIEYDDIYFIPYWEISFSNECGVEPSDIKTRIEVFEKHLEKKIHFIWQDRLPVSQACVGRQLQNGVVVNGVYTPPPFRGKGYATSCVFEVSKLFLEKGNSFCCLFADSKNPVSNKIYNNIGYENACMYKEIILIKK